MERPNSINLIRLRHANSTDIRYDPIIVYPRFYVFSIKKKKKIVNLISTFILKLYYGSQANYIDIQKHSTNIPLHSFVYFYGGAYTQFRMSEECSHTILSMSRSSSRDISIGTRNASKINHLYQWTNKMLAIKKI